MQLTGLHLLLSYQCTFECDHCFVWGSPWQNGTMTLEDIEFILQAAKSVPEITSIYFEGGEPFLYYAVLIEGVKRAVEMGFEVGIVSNAYWANSPQDAETCLRPLKGFVEDLTVSSDLFHYSEKLSHQAQNAQEAAIRLGIPTGMISIAKPENPVGMDQIGQIPEGDSGVMYRGRAAEKLAPAAPQHPWHTFNACPYEDLVDPGRVHVDPLGNLHICQGISLGNLFGTSIQGICERYDPETHPIVGPILQGGPAQLVQDYRLTHDETYADACHLCYQARSALRTQYPEILRPDQMYGVF
jgi:hypothetical protein